MLIDVCITPKNKTSFVSSKRIPRWTVAQSSDGTIEQSGALLPGRVIDLVEACGLTHEHFNGLRYKIDPKFEVEKIYLSISDTVVVFDLSNQLSNYAKPSDKPEQMVIETSTVLEITNNTPTANGKTLGEELGESEPFSMWVNHQLSGVVDVVNGTVKAWTRFVVYRGYTATEGVSKRGLVHGPVEMVGYTIRGHFLLPI